MGYAGRHFPNKLKKFRRLLGHQQAEAANILEVDPSELSRWERGVTVPGLENLFKLSVLYRTLPQEMFPDQFKEIRSRILRNERQSASASTHEKTTEKCAR
jgi:transcriptional regulator with XRE-family HTH domain